MRILVVGATGTIGRKVVAALQSDHDIVAVSHGHTPITVDLGNPASIHAMYRVVGRIDAVVSAAGRAKFAALDTLTDDDFAFSVGNKLMGQINLVRFGLDYIADAGSFTLTAGFLARAPTPGATAISMVNAGLEGFARGAALDLPRRIRVNVVSPPWVTETLEALHRDPSGGVPAAVVARWYVESVTGTQTGTVLEPQPS
jgi:NAD(P)-dependent dehydrogenase (short-subunit alcohol dehydrogenase family)